MRVLVACEESQAVAIEMRRVGHEAYSCDMVPCSGGHPEWHIQGDVTNILNDGWDMIIAFPPCTDLAIGGARHWAKKRADGRQAAAAAFFMRFVDADCPHIAIENPAGVMSELYRPPDQYIQPYWFGDSAQKQTGLWLKNLPKLIPTNIVNKGEYRTLSNGKRRPEFMWRHTTDRQRQRSKTFSGIARAMAEQWGRGELSRQLEMFAESHGD